MIPKSHHLLAFIFLFGGNAWADKNPNIIRLGGVPLINSSYPSQIEPVFTEWQNVGNVYDCFAWTPRSEEFFESTSLTQYSSECKINQERLRQVRMIDSHTGSIINVGDQIKEYRTVDATNSRNYTINYSEWVVDGAPFGCNNWQPDPASVTWGEPFIQNSYDCQQRLARSRVDTYINDYGIETTQSYGTFYNLLNNISQSRDAIGKKDGWVVIEPSYTEWSSTKINYNCSNWIPLPSSVSINSTFLQRSSDCKTDKVRYRQDREQLISTGEIRSSGEAEIETKTILNQESSRSYTVTLGEWINVGDIYGCNNWSPGTGSVTSGQSFTQTATDCEQDQQRTRFESYIFEETSEVTSIAMPNEHKTVTVSSSRQATGTYAPVKACLWSSGTHYVRVVTSPDNVMAGDLYWDGAYIGGGFNSHWYYSVEKGGKTYHTSSGEIKRYYVDERGNSWREYAICGYY